MVCHKKIEPAQNILGLVKGQGINYLQSISYKPYCQILQNHSLSQSIMLENLLARQTSFFFFQKDSESSRSPGTKKASDVSASWDLELLAVSEYFFSEEIQK